MNKFQIISLLCFIIAGFLFILGFLSEEVSGGFVIIFPIIIGTGIYSFFAMLLIIIGFITWFFGSVSINIEEEFKLSKSDENLPEKRKIKGGGLVFIGPIPIIFGSNWKITLVLMLVALIII